MPLEMRIKISPYSSDPVPQTWNWAFCAKTSFPINSLFSPEERLLNLSLCWYVQLNSRTKCSLYCCKTFVIVLSNLGSCKVRISLCFVYWIINIFFLFVIIWFVKKKKARLILITLYSCILWRKTIWFCAVRCLLLSSPLQATLWTVRCRLGWGASTGYLIKQPFTILGASLSEKILCSVA